MKTVRQIFEMSMAIADSLNNAGQAVNGDNSEYQYRTPAIINLLQSELVMKGKLFNVISFNYPERDKWVEYELPSNFNEASKIVIFDGSNYYKSIKYEVKEKEVEEEKDGHTIIINKKFIYFKSSRTGTIKVEYIPNPTYVENIDDELELSDAICTNVLPYGLTAILFLDENSALASYCQQKFEENKEASSSRLTPNVLEDIEDVYLNAYEGMAF